MFAQIAATSSPLSWRLAELQAPKSAAPTVFSCFHCGGGSSMGYKLAGYNVLGGVELDGKMMRAYRTNLKPRESYLCDIRSAPLPKQQIDLVDGSPPCSPFTFNGKRDANWGVAKEYKEGGFKQTLDDLFFAFLSYAAAMRPRVIVGENVEGLRYGKAKPYFEAIQRRFARLGYALTVLLLNAADYGVPQRRNRLFFIGHRAGKKLRMPNSAPKVTIQDALRGCHPSCRDKTELAHTIRSWHASPLGKQMIGGPVRASYRLSPADIAPCLTSGNTAFFHWDKPHELSISAYARLQSFPDDYYFGASFDRAKYILGMSVPPFLMRALAQTIMNQLF